MRDPRCSTSCASADSPFPTRSAWDSTPVTTAPCEPPTASLSSTLFTIGWLRRGELWESVAIPEIRTQAAEIAGRCALPG